MNAVLATQSATGLKWNLMWLSFLFFHSFLILFTLTLNNLAGLFYIKLYTNLCIQNWCALMIKVSIRRWLLAQYGWNIQERAVKPKTSKNAVWLLLMLMLSECNRAYIHKKGIYMYRKQKNLVVKFNLSFVTSSSTLQAQEFWILIK